MIDWQAVWPAVASLVALAGLIVTLHQHRKRDLKEGFEQIAGEVKEQTEEFARHTAKDEQDIEQLREFIRALERDIARDFIRRIDFDRAMAGVQGSLSEIKGDIQGITGQLLDLNRYLRDQAGKP